MSAERSLVVASIAASRFLPQARVLAGSLARHHSGLPLEVALVDGPVPGGASAAEPFRSRTLDELDTPCLPLLRFRRTQRQIAISMKPFLLARLLEEGAERVLFLDADCWVTAPLDPLLDRAARHAMVLTPHRLSPVDGVDAVAAELALLRVGTFNGGVLSIGAAARGFASWWCSRLLGGCVHEPARGLHDDQRWLDLAPGFVDDLHVLRDAGVNVAYWNLDERPRVRRGGELRAGDATCRLIHWSGFDPDRPERLSRHDAVTGTAAEPLAGLVEEYRAAVEAGGWSERLRDDPYARFADGEPIPEVARQLHDEMGEEAERFGDPFAVGSGSFREWLRGGTTSAPGGIPRIWWAIYRLRTDVRAAFRDPGGADRDRFLAWCRTSGAREHGVGPSLQPD
jgi:hypothetical protein